LGLANGTPLSERMALAIEHGMDRAFGWHPDLAIEPSDQELADLARPPMRLLALETDDQALDRWRQLVGITHRPAGAIGQRPEPMLLVAIENLVAGLARYSELPARIRHRLPVQQAGDKAQAFLHHRTRFPRHQHLPPNGEKCYPCVRYGMSPMSRAAQGLSSHPELVWSGLDALPYNREALLMPRNTSQRCLPIPRACASARSLPRDSSFYAYMGPAACGDSRKLRR
jgi:hypothetical protein